MLQQIVKTAREFFTRWRPIIALAIGLYITLLYMHWQVCGTPKPIMVRRFWIIAFDVDILVIVYALLPIRTGRWIGVPLLLGAIYALGNVLFSRYLLGYMPINAWLEFDNLNGLGPSIISGLRWTDFVLVAILGAIAAFAARRGVPYPRYAERAVLTVGTALVLAIGFFRVCRPDANSLQEWWQTEFKDGFIYDRQMYTYYNGIFLTTCGELKETQHKSKELTQQEVAEIETFLQRQPFSTHIDKPRHVLFVITESLIAAPIDTVIDGQEVTPTLNKLKREGLYCGNMTSDIQKGASSDGQFIYFTGLLPKQNGITILDCLENEYRGLGTMARDKGYETILLNPVTKSFWRQNQACVKYGIDIHYSIEDYREATHRDVTMWLSDELVFEYAYSLLQKHKGSPTFMTVLTATMHLPYNMGFDDALVEFPALKDKEYACYLQKVNYTDKHLGLFLDKLEADGLLDDMIIVVASDHHKPSSQSDYRTKRPLPLIVYGKGITPREVDGTMHQTDVYPTLLNIFGYEQLPYMGLGRSVFDVTADEQNDDNTQRISDLIIDGNYFK